jgi:hypothetical protein
MVCVRTLAHELNIQANGSVVEGCRFGDKCTFLHDWKSIPKDQLLLQIASKKARLFQQFPHTHSAIVRAIKALP